jgi:predicted SprT family Zn-dependent metalloprotease
MSRRKDQERWEAMRRLDPDYKGFRGPANEPTRSRNAPLEPVTCSVCGRKRNVPRGIAQEQGDTYVCSACSAERESGASDSQTTERD